MKYGLVFNSIVCFLITVIIVPFGLSLLKKGREDPSRTALASFLLSGGALWAMVGVGGIFNMLELPALEVAVYYLTECMIALHLIPAAYLLTLKVFKDKSAADIILGVYIFLAIVMMYFLFSEGFVYVHGSYFSSSFRPRTMTFMLFCAMTSFIFLEGSYLLYVKTSRWLLQKTVKDFHEMVFFSTMMLYGLFGFLDEAKWVAHDFEVVFIRIMIFFSFAVLCLSVDSDEGIVESEVF